MRSGSVCWLWSSSRSGTAAVAPWKVTCQLLTADWFPPLIGVCVCFSVCVCVISSRPGCLADLGTNNVAEFTCFTLLFIVPGGSVQSSSSTADVIDLMSEAAADSVCVRACVCPE